MNELLAELSPSLLSIASTLLLAFGTWLTLQLNAWLKAGKTDKEYAQIKNIIEDTVSYVEQVAKRLELDSNGKLELATKTASEWLVSKGFKVTEAELNVLIESMVRNSYGHWNDYKVESVEEPKAE